MRYTPPLLAMLSLVGCKTYDPLYCDEDHRCTDPSRSFCDVNGDYPASEGVGRTCIADPSAVAGDAGADDGGAEDAAPLPDGSLVDAGACSWSRLAKLANVNRPGDEDEFVGSVDGGGLTLYFWRSDQFFRAERAAADQPFGQPFALEFDAEDLSNPEVSETGLELFFTDAGNASIGRAARATTDAAFVGREDTGLDGYSPSLSGDGLSIYYAASGGLQQATRKAVESPWSEPRLVLSTGVGAFWDVDVSPDGLRVLLVDNPLGSPIHPLQVAERSSLDVEFSPPVPVDPAILFAEAVSYSYAGWTADGRELVVTVARDSQVDMFHSVCR
ncbi:MAG TPA: hypothetical protein VK698_16525 [Kofleriaceae bacterium]|nr:hypothetical protein [Kofleriaceae bacterium]